MRIEHVALQVDRPGDVADWYVQHLGFTIRRSADTPVPVRFLADGSGQVMLEVYRNPSVSVPAYETMDPLLLHLAFVCADIPAERARLIQAGCRPVGEIDELPNGDAVAMLRDPWGLAIQLARRAEPMV